MDQLTENEARLLAKIEFLNKELNELKETVRFQRGDIWDMDENVSSWHMRTGVIIIVLILASLSLVVTDLLK